MYVKRVQDKDGYSYHLCESYLDDGLWRDKRLMALGPDPAQHIECPGGNGFYIKEGIEDRLRVKGVKYATDELEHLFVPFLEPHVRRMAERSMNRGRMRERWRGYAPEVLLKRQEMLHSFDKRRLHYLRFGRVDIGDLDGRPWKFLNVLLDKSRDEIETLFEEMENYLSVHEIRPYLYTALHLQTHFRHLLTRNRPEALDPERVDAAFLDELCRLNRDETFFLGVDRDSTFTLHAYLRKYLILYFDNAFDPRVIWDDYVQDFRWRHQFHRKPEDGLSLTEKEACDRLGIRLEAFSKMEREDLIRFYRRKAKETHPDTGGDKTAFVAIKNAFDCLLRLKS